MKKTAAIILAALIGLMTGCKSAQKNDSESAPISASDMSSSTTAEVSEPTNDSEPISQPETTSQPKTEEEYHKAMVERSLVSVGNTSRLNAKIEQAKSGKKTVVAYIGGSITEGYPGDPDDCYAKLSYDYFAETYGTGNNVEYVNAGVSGTASTVGDLRVGRDVLSHDADIVFIEYAVNDGQDEYMKTSYESLVKTVLTQENEPAVVLLFNRTKDGYSAQSHMKMIGTHYSLPMISVVDAITPEFNEGRMTWEDYSADEAHPNPEGHKLIREFIEYMYRTAESTQSEPYEVPEEAVFSTKYTDAVMTTLELSNEEITVTDSGSFAKTEIDGNGFKGYWEYNPRTVEGSDPIKITARGRTFFMIFRTNKAALMGSVDVYINGELVKTVNSRDTNGGWGGPAAEVVAEYDEVTDMDIEIRPAADDTGRRTFNLFAVAVTQN